MRIAFIASPKPAAQAALGQFVARYGQRALVDADYVVAIGGDGTVLKVLHAVMAAAQQPVLAMRVAGSLGHLANPLRMEDLPQRLRAARRVTIYPLQAEVEYAASCVTVRAVNEIVFARQRLQAAKLRVAMPTQRFADLTGDGLLVASAIGSSGYNRSAGGPTLAHGSSLLALTAITPHQRCEWYNTVVADDVSIDVDVLDPEYRPVRLETSMTELTDIRRARVTCCRSPCLSLLYDMA